MNNIPITNLITNKKVKFSTLIIIFLVLLIISLLVFGGLYFYKLNPVNAIVSKIVQKTSVAPKYLFTVTAAPSGDGLNKPLAVVSDALGRIYVADTGNGVIKSFDPSGQFLAAFGKEHLSFPFQMTYAKGQIWVADPTLKKVQVFNTNGTFDRTFVESPKAKDANAKEDLLPTAVAVSDSGEVYVADTTNHVVRVYDAKGNELRRIGHSGNNKGGLTYPNALWVADKKLYVSDSNNARIQIYDLQGNIIQTLDAAASKTGAIAFPRGLVVTPRGEILVVDVFMHMVRAFDQQGNELWTLGIQGLNNGEFNFPNGLWLDGAGQLYVTDRENNRVQVFKF